MGLTYIKSRFLHPVKMKWYDLQIEIIGAWKFFLKRQRSGERKLTKIHYQSTDKICGNKRSTVIYMANGYTWHGGLADRLKGIVSLYAWCSYHSKPFKINFCHPFRLHNYLIPNEYDWQIADEDISYNPCEVAVKQCLIAPVLAVPTVQPRLPELLGEWLDEHLVQTNAQLHVYTNMRYGNSRFAELFGKLFKPAPRLQNLIDYHKEQIGGKYISISFRFTTLLGDFTDCTGAALPVAERQPLIEKCLHAISQIAKTAPSHDRILVTADSSTFLAQAAALSHVYVIPGKVGHIDYDNDDDVNMKTFLDFLLIADAEAVYLCKSGKMYKSAFAQTAAMVHNKPFEVKEC